MRHAASDRVDPPARPSIPDRGAIRAPLLPGAIASSPLGAGRALQNFVDPQPSKLPMNDSETDEGRARAMAPLKLAAWILALLAGLTLARSLIWIRPATIAASAALLVAASAILRARTWGLLLSLSLAAAFGSAAALGIGPLWFWIVASAGALPTLLAAGPLLRFDRIAALSLALFSLSAGALGALTYAQLLGG